VNLLRQGRQSFSNGGPKLRGVAGNGDTRSGNYSWCHERGFLQKVFIKWRHFILVTKLIDVWLKLVILSHFRVKKIVSLKKVIIN